MKYIIDTELAIKVHSVQSSFTEDTLINDFIKNYIESLGLTYTLDNYGNIYTTKGEGKNGYVGIVSHTDTVHKIYENRQVYKQGDYLFAFAVDKSEKGPDVIKQVGVGGDDKAGVLVCLQALSRLDNIKCVFFRFEESGCRGSNNADMKFFKDCNFLLQADRRGGSDFITKALSAKIASNEFFETVKDLVTEHGYSECIYGSSTDVAALSLNNVGISCVNLSAGYYNPHSDGEVVSLSDLNRCYSLIEQITLRYGDRKFAHKVEKYVPTTYTYSGYSSTCYRKKFILKEKLTITTPNVKEINPLDLQTVFGLDKFKRYTLKDGYYEYVSNEPILTKVKCPYCENHLHFLKEEGDLYCTHKCNDFMYNPELFKDFVIMDGDVEFVFAVFEGLYLKKNEAVFSEQEGEWVLKHKLVY